MSPTFVFYDDQFFRGQLLYGNGNRFILSQQTFIQSLPVVNTLRYDLGDPRNRHLVLMIG